MKIDRTKITDAQKIWETLLPNKNLRQMFSEFLTKAIEKANTLKASNWNLNLDKNGKFIRFNVGQEYCIQLKKDELLIVCDKKVLTKILPSNFTIQYLYHDKRKRIKVNDISKCKLDCLDNVPDSIGCIISPKLISEIKYFMEPMLAFLDVAIKNTTLLVQSKTAHSTGAIKYLTEITNKTITQPSYVEIGNEKGIHDFQIELENQILKSAQDSSEVRLARLAKANKKPEKVFTTTRVYKRNADVIVERLNIANGICERCKKTAPFIRKSDNTPYLEVHHIKALSEDGEDTLENTIALCPNCHRELHLGK